MTALAALLSLALAFPQDKEAQKADPRFTSVLTPAEQKQLNDKMRAWFDAGLDLLREEATGPKREQARKKEKDTLDALETDLKKISDKKGDLKKHLGDLKAILKNVIPFRTMTGFGEVKLIKPKEGASYSIVVPKTYRETTSYRAVFVVPGFDADKKIFTPHKEWYDKTWKGVDIAESTLFVLPTLDDKMDFEPLPDPARDGEVAQEKDRIGAFLQPLLSHAYQDLHFDLDRVILDCGKGSNAFALRLCTYFPQRFAGVILRHPQEVEGLRLETLSGIPVLLVSSAATKAACEKLEKALNALQAGSCTVLEGKGNYPFGDSKAEIAEWAKAVQRDLFKPKVTLAVTHNFFHDGYWVKIAQCDPIENFPVAERPSLTAEADAKENRITITSRGVKAFVLLLNDALVDLDKEVTIVVNGVAERIKLQRLSIKAMCAEMQRQRDTTRIFSTSYQHVVTAVEKDKDKDKDKDKKPDSKDTKNEEKPK